MTTTNDLLHHIAIEGVLNRYARACDQRNWAAFDAIFSETVAVNYGGEFRLEGRAAVVGMIRSMLGGCGPTQHLLGNFDITVRGTTAHSASYVRAVHAGLGAKADSYYEVWAEYRDTLELTADCWRITTRHMLVSKEVGDRNILGPD
ncbi:MAG: 3-phenylpropionate/cinnamic acid dioxygenase small subunit [Bacteroidia bacterium]|jgi:3-phenylpropionate/cinnamic acid dioxygenase small subunit